MTQQSISFSAEPAGLALASPKARLEELLRAHAELLKKVGRKRRELERFRGDVDELRAELGTRIAPLLERAHEIDAEVHRAFERLLASKKRSKRAKVQIEELYDDLRLLGVISPGDLEEELFGGAPPDDSADFAGNPRDYFPDPSDLPPRDREPGQSAGHHRGRSREKKSLRGLFLSLAEILHPDKAQDEEEKARATELMQELNRAYRDGDMARILEIEAATRKGEDSPALMGENEIDRRCRVLREQNALLAAQYQELLRELRLARRSELGDMLIEKRRRVREKDADPFAVFVDPLEESIERLVIIRDHIAAFEGGEMALDVFLAGPATFSDDGDDIFDDDELECGCPHCREVAMLDDGELAGEVEILEALLDLMAGPVEETKSRSVRSSRNKRKSNGKKKSRRSKGNRNRKR